MVMAKTAQPDPSTLLRLQSNISVQRYFEISLLLTLATGFVTVAMTGKLDLVSIVVVSTALAVKLWSYSREADFPSLPAPSRGFPSFTSSSTRSTS